MRQDIDGMAAQVKGWMDRDQESLNFGRLGISYAQYYGMVLDVLRDCSDKMRRVERVI
jgi:hypothetical protein